MRRRPTKKRKRIPKSKAEVRDDSLQKKKKKVKRSQREPTKKKNSKAEVQSRDKPETYKRKETNVSINVSLNKINKKKTILKEYLQNRRQEKKKKTILKSYLQNGGQEHKKNQRNVRITFR